MNITLKLYATLGKYLPDGAHKNQVAMDIANDATIVDVIESVNVPMRHCHLVLVNGVFVPPQQRASHVLAEGDALAIWPPVAGG